jgi:hypothetical protein
MQRGFKNTPDGITSRSSSHSVSIGDYTVIHQYYAQRFRHRYPLKLAGIKKGVQIFTADPRDKPIGTIAVGTIIYIQDGVSPLRGLTRDVVCREPWIVEAWIPRDYSKWDDRSRAFHTVRIAGGHLAQVRSLRDRRRVQQVADWILLSCVDAGLEKI